jgi:hypothetical protein
LTLVLLATGIAIQNQQEPMQDYVPPSPDELDLGEVTRKSGHRVVAEKLQLDP